MSWSHEEKSDVWFKGHVIPNFDGNTWRYDDHGNAISWHHYGDRNSEYGWEIDHIDPNGGDNLSNLRPLHWRANVAKSDSVI